MEQAQEIDRELYLGIVSDRGLGRPVIMMSAAGGMEIEEVAARTPELIIKEAVNPITGCMPYQARNLAFGVGLDPSLLRPAVSFIENLYRMFVSPGLLPGGDQPPGGHQGRQDAGPGRQAQFRRQRHVPPPRPGRPGRPGGDGPPGV